jgi:beta-glucosidase
MVTRCAQNTIPERQLLEYFVPSFRAAIDAGGATMMAAYGSINGVPVTGSRSIMTELLRDELGFEGMIGAPLLCLACGPYDGKRA